MQYIDTRDFTTAVPATLAERFLAHGLRPISEERVEVHKATELANAPKATPFYAVLRHVNTALGTLALALLVSTLEALAFRDSLLALASFTGLTALVFGAIFLGGGKIYGPAKWIDGLQLCPPPQISLLVAKVTRISPHGKILADKLVQNSVILDPVWWVYEGEDRVCFAITGNFGQIIASA